MQLVLQLVTVFDYVLPLSVKKRTIVRVTTLEEEEESYRKDYDEGKRVKNMNKEDENKKERVTSSLL
jgi:hypothetical protein